jgi:ribosomal protein S6
MQNDMAPNEKAESARVYEAGLLLVPSIAQENVAKSFDAIKKAIEKAGGEIVSEEIPTLRTLAYTMVKALTGRKIKYSTAYFGWVKFEGSAELAKEIDAHLKASEDVLRYLVIKTVRENTLYSHRVAMAKAEADAAHAAGVGAAGAGDESPASEVEMDKSIEKLLV